MIADIFEKLDDNQKYAAGIIDRNLEIIACAGAGKTRTITRRIIYLIDQGVKPENIVAITFTRKAAAEMRARIYAAGQKYLGNTEGFAGMYIGTIDAFCLKMLQDYEAEFAKFSVIDEVQTKVFLQRYGTGKNDEVGFTGSIVDNAENLNEHTNGWGRRFPERYARKLEIYTGLMDILNSCSYDENYTRNWDDGTREMLAKYNKALKKHKYFDYSSIIQEMIKLLEQGVGDDGSVHGGFAESAFNRVKYLIIDEYQDSNPPQEHLATLFGKYANANLCVVGDADQTIYQFRGSDESNILNFAKKHNAEVVNLNLDYRSTEAVVDIARKSIANNHLYDSGYVAMQKGTVPGSVLDYESGDTVWKEFNNYNEEASFIADRIKILHELGIPYSECAVLFRQRRRMEYGEEKLDFQNVLAQILKQRDIPYIVEGLNNLYKTDEYGAAIELFIYIYKSFYVMGNIGKRPNSGFVNVNLNSPEIIAHRKELISKWKKIGQGYNSPDLTEGIENAVKYIDGIDWDKMVYGHDFNMQEIFQNFIGYMKFVEAECSDAEEILYNLGKFSKVIADFELMYFTDSAGFKIANFLKHLKKVADGLYPEGKEDNGYIQIDGVRLMTIHQSKGLEFTAVFMPALVGSIFPGESFDRKGNIYSPVDAIEEIAAESNVEELYAVGGIGIDVMERRKERAKEIFRSWIPNYDGYGRNDAAERKLFYVGVTRAKKYLFLTYGLNYNSSGEKASIFLEEAKGSRFLKQYSALDRYTRLHLPEMNTDPLPMVLNFSLLSNYFDCPYRFKLSSFYGFIQPYNSNQGYGKVLHEIMMHIHRAWIDGKRLSANEIKDIAGDALFLPFASADQSKKALVGAERCAMAYYEQNKADADKIVAAEMDINIEMGDGVSVNGRIDLVKKIEADGSDRVAIVDLKSAGKDAEQCLNAEQLKIYALGYREMMGVDADYLMIYNLDHPDGSRNAKEKLSGEMMVEVQKRIKEAANCIRNSKLPRVKGDKCKDCYVKGLCRRK